MKERFRDATNRLVRKVKKAMATRQHKRGRRAEAPPPEAEREPTTTGPSTTRELSPEAPGDPAAVRAQAAPRAPATPAREPREPSRNYAHDDECVDEASDESFPASDPPSYTGAIAGPGRRHSAKKPPVDEEGRRPPR